MVEGTPLLRVQTGNRLEGSNPFVSAIFIPRDCFPYLQGCAGLGRKVPAQVSPSICSFADTLAAQSLGVVARHRPAQPKWHNHFLSRTKPLPLGPDAAL